MGTIDWYHTGLHYRIGHHRRHLVVWGDDFEAHYLDSHLAKFSPQMVGFMSEVMMCIMIQDCFNTKTWHVFVIKCHVSFKN